MSSMASICQSGSIAQRRFRECFDAHHSGQHRRALDPMIVQERLDRRIQVVSIVRPP